MGYILVSIAIICLTVSTIIDRICEYLENKEKYLNISEKSTHED